MGVAYGGSAPGDPTEEHNRELVRRLRRDLLGSGGFGVIDEFFAEDFTSYNMPLGMPAGREGVRRFFETLRDGLSDIDVTIDELIVEGDRVAVATTTTGRHTGELLGIEPSGREVSFTGLDLVRISRGRIVEHRGLTDTVGLMRQLAGE